MSYQEELVCELQLLLSSKNTFLREKEIFSKAVHQLNTDAYFLKVINDLKKELSILAINNQLSPEALKFYGELSRRNPGSGVSAMWNFLIKNNIK